MTQTPEQERAWWDAADPATEIWGVGTWEEGIQACLDTIVPALNIGDNDRVLDLGVGPGRLAIPIAQAYPSTTVWGTDVSEAMAARCRDKSHHSVWALAGDGRRIPMTDDFFDCAYSVAMFQHLPLDAVRGYLTEIRRVLRPAGRARLQHVLGTENSFLSHQVPDPETFAGWCEDAGLMVTAVDVGVIHHQWVWLTVEKP